MPGKCWLLYRLTGGREAALVADRGRVAAKLLLDDALERVVALAADPHRLLEGGGADRDDEVLLQGRCREKVQRRCTEGAEKVQRKVQRKIPWYLEGREVLLWPAIVSWGRGGRWVAGVRRCVAARDESEETVRATVRCLW